MKVLKTCMALLLTLALLLSVAACDGEMEESADTPSEESVAGVSSETNESSDAESSLAESSLAESSDEEISEPPSGNSSYGLFYGENGSAQSGNSGNDFFEKCSACHGSGRCTHCGGDDEVKKFQAGLGWVEQNCTFCSGGRCRYCGGDGKP